ncbi:MAG: hypothetical protein JWO91_3665 [Acidobacteriaceae bacterium]|nr:hypothetical protein [Acidobacteriaceae bacterium]
MTNNAGPFDFHLQQESVTVAVRRGREQLQAIARCLTLHPELVAGSAVEGYIAAGQSALPCVTVHETEHQDFSIAGVLHDGRRQTCHLFEIYFD